MDQTTKGELAARFARTIQALAAGLGLAIQVDMSQPRRETLQPVSACF
jgi:hypothetical protein